MKATIYAHHNVIGTSVLKAGDVSMGGIYGEFVPTHIYYDKIQKTVWDFWDDKSFDYKRWYALNLNVQLDNGYFVFPVGYTIEDVEELPNEPLRIDISGLDWHVIDNFFTPQKSLSFLLPPWKTITIEQKITLEQTLTQALIQSKHLLVDCRFSALAIGPDQVLFTIRNPSIAYKYVIISFGITETKKTVLSSTQWFIEFADAQHFMATD